VIDHTLSDIVGQALTGSDGEKIGTVGQVYLDDQTGKPEWVTVLTGLFGTKETFVPIGAATTSGGALWVPYSKDKVEGAPNVDADGHLSHEEEAELFRYYGLSYDDSAAASSGPDISEEEHEVTLYEERPVVQKEEALPVEHVRLAKDTVSENVRGSAKPPENIGHTRADPAAGIYENIGRFGADPDLIREEIERTRSDPAADGVVTFQDTAAGDTATSKGRGATEAGPLAPTRKPNRYREAVAQARTERAIIHARVAAGDLPQGV